MAVNTAGQTARPRPAYSNAQHAAQSRRPGEPQSGGDIGGPRRFLGGTGIPTSGGTAKPGGPYSTDRHNDQGGKKLYLGKAFENAQRISFGKVKGNSVGRSELLNNHRNDTISKAAKTRLQSKHDATDGRGKGDEFAGQKLRPERPGFGPVRPDRKTDARDHGEHRDATARRTRRMEPGGMAAKTARSGA